MEYHFAINGAQSAAMDEAAINAAIADGRINGDTLAWTAGMTEWAAARTIPDLAARFPQLSAPPIPQSYRRPNAPPPVGDAPSPGGELAGFGVRFVAGFIDMLVLLIPNVIAGAVIPFGGLFVCAAYYLYFMSEERGGQTIGYKVMKLRLISQTDGRTKPWKDLGPYAGGLLVLGFIGWIWYFFDPRRRMLHNIFSKTVVVQTA